MERTVIRTNQAPAAIGPYSQAVVVPVGNQRMVFCSGQIPLDPDTMKMAGGDIYDQTRRCLDNLAAVLAAAGASLHDVVKTTIFLADLNDFGKVNEAYGERFGDTAPARSTVEAKRLPRDARIEIEAIAILR